MKSSHFLCLEIQFVCWLFICAIGPPVGLAEITGIVRSPDGTPFDGADVVLLPQGKSIYFNGVDLTSRIGRIMTKSAAGGAFSFPDSDTPYHLIAFHREGIGLIGPDEFEATHEIHLKRWARVEVNLLIGSKPGAQQEISIGRTAPDVFEDPMVDFSGYAKTGDDGKAVLENIPPDMEIFVGHQVRVGDDPNEIHMTYTATAKVRLAPGEFGKATLGGTGRPIIGRVVTPEGAELDINHTENSVRQKSPPLPKLPLHPDRKTNKKMFDTWTQSDEGQAALRPRHYPVPLKRDGTFRVEGVQKGGYVILIKVKKTASGQPDLEATKEFEVTDDSMSLVDEPIDVGVLQLEPAKPPKPGPTPDSEQMRKATEEYEAAKEKFKVGDLAPEFEVKSFDGRSIKMSDYRGKYVLLDFWATWCGPCVHEIPYIKKAQWKYRNDPRIAFISLSMDDGIDKPRKFAEKHGLKGDHAVIGDFEDTDLPGKYGFNGIPAIYLIGPDGKLIARDLREEATENAITSALASVK